MSVDLTLAPRVLGPLPATVPRGAGSVRRTATIDSCWPDGWGTSSRVLARGRDLLTPNHGGTPQVLREDILHVGLAPNRTIEDIRSVPPRPALGRLVGARGGGRLRSVLAEVIPAELSAGTPLYLLLDDLSGASLVSGFAFSQWPAAWPPEIGEGTLSGRRMESICIGFQPGSSALHPDGTARSGHQLRRVETILDPTDPIGWHQLPVLAEVSHRRARRIDVWMQDDGAIAIDSFFQDSAVTPDGGRVAVHEYGVVATADPVTHELLSVEATPRVLPYGECPLAVLNVAQAIGTPLHELRLSILAQFSGTAGCTHLNDMLRALAEAPVLVADLAKA